MRSRYPYILLLALVFCIPVQTAVADLSIERQQQLDSLLTHDCGSCHGLTRKGGLGPALQAEDMKKYSPEALVAVILNGIPQTAMPPWGALLNSHDAQYLANELLTPRRNRP
jgi:cytochrome c55X